MYQSVYSFNMYQPVFNKTGTVAFAGNPKTEEEKAIEAGLQKLDKQIAAIRKQIATINKNKKLSEEDKRNKVMLLEHSISLLEGQKDAYY